MKYKLILFVRSYSHTNSIIWVSKKEKCKHGVLTDLFTIQDEWQDECELCYHELDSTIFVNPDTKYKAIRKYNQACLIFRKTINSLEIVRK